MLAILIYLPHRCMLVRLLVRWLPTRPKTNWFYFECPCSSHSHTHFSCFNPLITSLCEFKVLDKGLLNNTPLYLNASRYSSLIVWSQMNIALYYLRRFNVHSKTWSYIIYICIKIRRIIINEANTSRPLTNNLRTTV